MPGNKVPALSADSSDVPHDERLEWWRGTVGDVFDIMPSLHAAAPGAAPAYDLRGTWWRYDKLILGAVSFDGHRAVRLARHVQADHLDHYRVILKKEGAVHFSAEEGRLTLQPGEILLHDLARPAEFDFEAGSNVILVVPRELLDEELPLPVDLHGVRLQGATANLLATHLQALVDHSSRVAASEIPLLTQATLNLLAASIIPSAQMLARASKAVETTLMRQICRYIDLHLGDADLSADTIGAFFQTSRSSLYRIFEPLGGVANFVKERRLAHIHDLLSQPGQRAQIGRLADDYGFNSAAHFSRAFRQQYGYSPSELKSGSAAVAPRAKSEAQSEQHTFHAWIRSLRG